MRKYETLFEKGEDYIILLDNYYGLCKDPDIVSLPDLDGLNLEHPASRVKKRGEEYFTELISKIQGINKEYEYIRIHHPLIGYIFLWDPVNFWEYFRDFIQDEEDESLYAKLFFKGKTYTIRISNPCDSFGDILIVPLGGIVI